MKLMHLDAWNRARAGHAASYAAALVDCDPLTVPQTGPGRTHVFHLYVVRSPHRDELRDHLSSRGIQTGLHYPIPIHLQTAYASLDLRQGAFPVAESWAATGLSLPMFPELTPPQVEEVVEGVRSFPLLAAAQANNR